LRACTRAHLFNKRSMETEGEKHGRAGTGCIPTGARLQRSAFHPPQALLAPRIAPSG
jgi:hypothetical protein